VTFFLLVKKWFVMVYGLKKMVKNGLLTLFYYFTVFLIEFYVKLSFSTPAFGFFVSVASRTKESV